MRTYDPDEMANSVTAYLKEKGGSAPQAEVVRTMWKWGPCQQMRNRETVTNAVLSTTETGRVRRRIVQEHPRRYELVLVEGDE